MKIAQQLRKIAFNVPRRCLATTSLDQERAVENCVSLVKQHDFDSYLAGRLLPQKYRGPYFAVRAFHVELAQVKDQSRGNVMSGRMRFQFWRDSIEQVFSESLSSSPQTPVARALHCYKQDFSQSQRFFVRAIDARQQELNIQQHETITELEDFAENAHSSILYILLNVFGATDEEMSYAASHVGVCSGIVTQLRGMAQLASQGEIIIPAETMSKHGLLARPVLKGPQTPEELSSLKEAVFDVASQAHGHLDEARSLVNGTSMFNTRPGFLALLPAARSQIFLDELRIADFNPYHPELLGNLQNPNQLRLMYNLFKSKSINRI